MRGKEWNRRGEEWAGIGEERKKINLTLTQDKRREERREERRYFSLINAKLLFNIILWSSYSQASILPSLLIGILLILVLLLLILLLILILKNLH